MFLHCVFCSFKTFRFCGRQSLSTFDACFERLSQIAFLQKFFLTCFSQCLICVRCWKIVDCAWTCMFGAWLVKTCFSSTNKRSEDAMASRVVEVCSLLGESRTRDLSITGRQCPK